MRETVLDLGSTSGRRLERWVLNENMFKQRDYYRLQQIEHIYNANQI